MKETKSESIYVGKIVTCPNCQRSYIIEVGDRIIPGRYGRNIKINPKTLVPCCNIWAGFYLK